MKIFRVVDYPGIRLNLKNLNDAVWKTVGPKGMPAKEILFLHFREAGVPNLTVPKDDHVWVLEVSGLHQTFHVDVKDARTAAAEFNLRGL